MLIVDNNLLAINKKGLLTIWDLNSLEKIFASTEITAHYTSLAKDINNQIYLGTEKGEIFKLNTTDFTIELYLKLKKKNVVSWIFFNSSNKVIATTNP